MLFYVCMLMPCIAYPSIKGEAAWHRNRQIIAISLLISLSYYSRISTIALICVAHPHILTPLHYFLHTKHVYLSIYNSNTSSTSFKAETQPK